MKTKFLLRAAACIALLSQTSLQAAAQDCTANAGGNSIICGSTTTLVGGVSGAVGAGVPTWTFISGPATPTIVSPNSFTTNITGMVNDGDYVFELSHACGTGTAISQVTITAHPRPTSFTAGPDITDVCATTGTTALAGVIPAGFTGEWRSVNISNRQRFGTDVSTNSQLSSATVGAPTFELINKANHEIDPGYYAILKITSVDGNCTYLDTAVVKFIPNPEVVPQSRSVCVAATGERYIDFQLGATAGPAFETSNPLFAGSPASGTTFTLNVVSTPPGGTLAYTRFADNRRMYVTGLEVPGTYTYNVTVSNDCGTYTTADYTYTVSGITPGPVNFQPSGHGAPEQLAVYTPGGTGGEHHCTDMVGTTTPERFYFDINDLDDPALITSTVVPNGIAPPGGFPTVGPIGGAGLKNRWVDVTPPADGWQVGTYRLNVRSTNGTCALGQDYYIHISDNSRPDVEVPDVSVCYPGTGSISATIPLPEVYKGVVNTSYFQDFGGNYTFSVVSKPAGSGTPVYEATNLRSITSTSTTISNLTSPGEYKFRVVAVGAGSLFLPQEYDCSEASIFDTFSVFVENPINANAGSDQIQTCVNSLSLLGNNPGTGTGLWTILDAPAGSSPVVTDPAAFSTTVSGVSTPGIYELSWAITSEQGGCTSLDTVSFEIISISPDAPTATMTPPVCGDTIGNITVIAPLGATYQYSIDGINYQTSTVFNDVPVGAYELSTRIGAAGCVSSTTTLANVTIPVCGTVYNDANGLSDNMVNGTGGTGGSTLYAILYDETTNEVVDVVTVNADGTYALGAIKDNDASIFISTAPATIGQTSLPVVTLPAGWVNTGEVNCIAAATCIGSDGTPDGVLTLGIVNYSITAANFGINSNPETDIILHELTFEPAEGSDLVLDGITAPLMSGSDLEDGDYSGNTGTIQNPQGVVITSLPTNGELWYFGFGAPVVVDASDITDGTLFDDPSMFAIVFSGTGYTSVSFGYAYVDAAGSQDPSPATYTVDWGEVLPVSMLQFDAVAKNNEVLLTWATASEVNNKGFEIERSATGNSWSSIGFVIAATADGNSTSVQNYSFTDSKPVNGVNYYRLKQIDVDGKFNYSSIRSVVMAQQAAIAIQPNPAKDHITVKGLAGTETIKIYSMHGRLVKEIVVTGSTATIALDELSAGMYHVNVVSATGVVFVSKVIKL